jgi:hypothetical protein
MLELTTNIVWRVAQHYQKSPTFTRGRTQNSKSVQSHVAVDISQEMLHVSNNEHRKLLTMDCATHHKNQLNAPQWVEGEWSKCSAPCGQNGTRERKVHCERISANG